MNRIHFTVWAWFQLLGSRYFLRHVNNARQSLCTVHGCKHLCKQQQAPFTFRNLGSLPILRECWWNSTAKACTPELWACQRCKSHQELMSTISVPSEWFHPTFLISFEVALILYLSTPLRHQQWLNHSYTSTLSRPKACIQCIHEIKPLSINRCPCYLMFCTKLSTHRR